MTYRPGEMDMSSMWSILGMTPPQVATSSAVGLSGRVGGWNRTLVLNGSPWAFQKIVKDVGAWYISRDSRYLLVVEETE